MRYLVNLKWLPFEKGGRQTLPQVDLYYCNTWLGINEKNLWSIALDFTTQDKLQAELFFLFDTYPKIIQVNQEIKLYEGPCKVIGHALVLKILEDI